jgi:glyoxylase I family protein
VAVHVTDLASIRSALDKKGIGYSLSRSGRPALFCRDPDGNTFELIQPPVCSDTSP